MRILPKNKSSKGIIQLPILLIAGGLITAAALLASSNGNSKKVLSESSDTGSGQEVRTTGTEVRLNAETETPEASETPEPEEFEREEEVEVKDGSSEAKIKIRSGENKFEFQQEGTKISVESNFPLSVNPTTRELTVTTPAGTKVVAILPQQAVDNMLAGGVISSTAGVDLKTEDDGSISYSIDGVKNEKLLGVFNVSVPKTIIVSAQTGQVVVVNQSVFSKILDLLSV